MNRMRVSPGQREYLSVAEDYADEVIFLLKVSFDFFKD